MGCMIDMGEFPEPFYYPVQMVVTYGKPYWPSYSTWMVDPKRGREWTLLHGKYLELPGGDV